MRARFEDISNKLKKNKIRLSYQRLKVSECLSKNHGHPTVDQIYNDLRKEVPTLSKTTVYNALTVLCEARLVRVITIEDNETRYELITKSHGHFKCVLCGEIYDFNINIDSFDTEDLDNFKITDKDVYFKGTCPRCLANKK